MARLRNFPQGRFHLDQYDRVLRWYERFEKINNGQQGALDSESEYDDVLAFFMNCDHLYDWVRADFSVRKSHPDRVKSLQFLCDVKTFRENNDCLKICADISVGAKHLIPDRKPHFQDEICLNRHQDIVIHRYGETRKSYWKIKSNSGDVYDAFEIASQCVNKWREFLQMHKKQILDLIGSHDFSISYR